MLLGLSCLFLLLANTIFSQTLPYNPTTALLSNDLTAIYILESSNGGTYQLSAINLTSTISNTQTRSTVVVSSLPFNPQPSTAIVGSINTNNTITLTAGDCNDGASATQIWTISPQDSQPQWTQTQTNTGGVQSPSANGGINMLGGIAQFDSQTYTFGGMCPNSTSLTINTWQNSAAYSNFLTSISSTGSINQIVTRGPPVAEAGFSMTPLTAAYKNGSTMASTQNFVLIGGQTQTAFINMSQVALFSLPEQSWAFASVYNPASLSGIERSGHAAALSSDGTKIFVSGGWVGDVNTPAEPHFLTLNVGSAYGGSGEWTWEEPNQTGTAPSLYGHSMILLPGDILMITGGYTLPSSSSKRRDTSSSGSTYFFDTSTSSWVNEYTSPLVSGSTSSPSSTTSNSLKIGLGVGLGLGLGLLIILLLCLWFGRRKIREHRRNRDRRLLQQSMNAANGPECVDTQPAQWMLERSRNGADPYPWAPTHGDTDSIRRASQAEGTGRSFDVPSPTRGLRRSLHSRPNSVRFDDRNQSRAPGRIHTIAESDENEKNQDQGEQDILASAPVLDPFQDPVHLLDRRSPSPVSPAIEREREMQHWYDDWATVEKHRQSGRSSPNKSDRTSSSLSDSNRSVVSALSYQPSVRREGSKKSTPQISPPDSPTTPVHQRKRARSFGLGSKSAEKSFPRLQAEGQALLGGSPITAGPPPSSSRPVSGARGLLGSLRRALAGDRNSTGPERSATTAGNTFRAPGDTSPQRSASLGAMTYSQRRQGAQDWGENPSPPKSTHEDTEDDWDVESAVERRVVQVMFTVPRERLRVVNAGPDGDGVSVAEAETPLIEHAEGHEGDGRQAEE